MDDARNSTMAQRFALKREPLTGAFFCLSAFYTVYCVRPEDWIPTLGFIPLAKISGIFTLLALMMSVGRTPRRPRDLPREASYFFGIICLLFVSSLISPVWRGGAFFKTLNFTKAVIVWVLTFLVITSFRRLRRIIFIQSASVAVITVVSLLKGRSHPRLEGVIGGIYSNPNDLAFAIVLSLPFCFAFLFSTRSIWRKAAWAAAMLAMCDALFMTASRAGFIDLMVTGAVCLWLFGIKGKRFHIVVAATVVALIIGFAAGGRLNDRLFGTSDKDLSAHGSYLQRRLLIVESIYAVARHPLGIGMGNFANYSGQWREVHVSYLQIAVEGGIATFVLYLLFFWRGFCNLKQLRRMPSKDPEIALFSGALYATLIGFVVGACFAPEAYQYFPYFAEAYTAVLLAIVKERQQSEVPSPDLSNRPQRLWSARPQTDGVPAFRGASFVRSGIPGRPLRNRP